MVHWPELTKFCGCCSLSTGIYIVGTIQAIANVILAHFDVKYLIYLIESQERVFGYKYPEEARDEQIEVVSPVEQEDWMFLLQMHRILVTHIILWFLCRVMILFSIGALFYGIHKSKSAFIKGFLSLNFPVWLFTLMNLAVDMITYTWMERFFAVLLALVGAYQLLSVRTAHRLMTGKLKIYIEDDNNTEMSSPATHANSDPPPYNEAFRMTPHNITHCSTCSRGITQRQGTRQITEEESFGPNQLVGRNMVLEMQEGTPNTVASGTNAENSIARRPTNLALAQENDSRSNKEMKKELEDVQVIYDEEQLNVGGSPIVETR